MNQLLLERLEALKPQHLTRSLHKITGIDLSSNDYLGFAQDETLHQKFIETLSHPPLGAGGSRLLRGNLALYEETENKLAAFVNREAALLFPSGYQANIALLSALLRAGDIVFSDALNHASLIDGMRLSRAEKIIYPHCDLESLEMALKKTAETTGLKIIVTESLFSMEGTVAPLKKLAALAHHYRALLIVDEAHSTGVWGASLVDTLGLTPQVFATIHTGGKGLGASGAWVAGSHCLKNYLVNFARPFLFSTAPIPALALLLQDAITHYNNVGHTRAITIKQRAKTFRHRFPTLITGNEESPILPVILGKSQRAMTIADQLQKRSWDVRAIRPPTVAADTSRLRITIKWCNTEEQLEKFSKDLSEVMK